MDNELRYHPIYLAGAADNFGLLARLTIAFWRELALLPHGRFFCVRILPIPLTADLCVPLLAYECVERPAEAVGRLHL